MISIDSAPQVVIQSLPVLFGFVLWIILECARRKRAASDRVRYVVRMFTLLCTIATSLVLWRFTTVVTCELNQQSIVWNVLACAVLLGTSLLVLLGLAGRVPRLAILASFLIGVGIVVVDVGLRGWWGIDGGRAAQHLMPLQHLWVLHGIAVLFHLERSAPMIAVMSRRPTTPAPTHRSVVELVDSLARRDDPQSTPQGEACSVRGRERSNSRL